MAGSLPSVQQRRDAGRAARATYPRAGLAALTTTGREPMAVLRRQNEGRVPELIPVRVQRMSHSPLTFYRGTAAIMAGDLARDANSGISVASCGDAHLSNFGFYASAERNLLFDLNDFDEAAWAPWEWDVKRLVTSVVVAGQATSRDDAVVCRTARACVLSYCEAVGAALTLSPLSRYFAHFSAQASAATLDDRSRAVLRAAVKDARRRTGERAARRLTTESTDGTRRFVEEPPTLVRIDAEQQAVLGSVMSDYLASVSVDIRLLMQHYAISDAARRVVGVGSVGTRCSLVLFQDGDRHALLLQTKQAVPSVLIAYGHAAQPQGVTEHVERFGDGGRVVALQRILQAFSDPFLGHLSTAGVDLYVRQFHDMKGSIDVETLDDIGFMTYARACGVVLARAHSQSPNAADIAGYVGSGRRIAESLVTWAYAYADLSRRDYEQFIAAQS